MKNILFLLMFFYIQPVSAGSFYYQASDGQVFTSLTEACQLGYASRSKPNTILSIVEEYKLGSSYCIVMRYGETEKKYERWVYVTKSGNWLDGDSAGTY